MGGRVVLYQHTGKMAGQIFVLVPCADNDCNRVLLAYRFLGRLVERQSYEKIDVINKLYAGEQYKYQKQDSFPSHKHGAKIRGLPSIHFPEQDGKGNSSCQLL